MKVGINLLNILLQEDEKATYYDWEVLEGVIVKE